MFANIFMLSLLTIIYGTKGDEGGGGRVVERSAINFLPQLSQQHSNDDLNFIKTSRSIRTPFRNTEIMTARGFGKRSGDEGEFNEALGEKRVTEQQANEDYRDEVVNNLISQKQLLLPFNNNNQFLRNPPSFKDDFAIQDNSVPSIKNHRLQIRDGTLKFRLNDGNLRIGRGFGKRSGFGSDPVVENFRMMQFLRKMSNQNQQFSPLPMAYNTMREEA